MPLVNASGERFKYDAFNISHRIPHFLTLTLYFIGLHIDKKTLTPDELADELLVSIKTNGPLCEAPDVLSLSKFCLTIFAQRNYSDFAQESRVEFLKAFSVAHAMFSPTEVAEFTWYFKSAAAGVVSGVAAAVTPSPPMAGCGVKAVFVLKRRNGDVADG